RADKIGTGEGAQAYGVGAGYLAEKEGAAGAYKQAGVMDPRDAMSLVIDSAKRYQGDDAQLRGVIKSGLYRHPALSAFGDVDEVVDDLVRVVRGQEAGGTVSNDAIRAYGRIDRAVGDLPKGKMYEANIHADPEDFLDWDAPLSQQSEKVRANLGAALKTNQQRVRLRSQEYEPTKTQGGWMVAAKENGYLDTEAPMFKSQQEAQDWIDSDSGESIYRQLSEAFAPHENAPTSVLRSHGIPGIKYLDGASRAAGQGSRNYVVFDEKLISIVKKYGVAGAVSAGLINETEARQLKAQGHQ
ncbi:MAG: hypothetical protein O3A25_18940, partial [Acidobacteria bacterium]|nr:hypothetical protein [Acidobacteriota bacterium]